jgi:hypothetical protein
MSPRADGSAEKSEGDRAGRASVGLRKNRKEPARGWDRGACSRRTEADSGIEYYSIPWVWNSAAPYIYIYIYIYISNVSISTKYMYPSNYFSSQLSWCQICSRRSLTHQHCFNSFSSYGTPIDMKPVGLVPKFHK